MPRQSHLSLAACALLAGASAVGCGDGAPAAPEMPGTPATAEGLLDELDRAPAGDWDGVSHRADGSGQLREEEARLLAEHQAAPDDPRLLAELGRVYTEAGATARALPFLARALDAAPDRARSWVHLGENLEILGREQDALVVFEKALELSPEMAQAHARIAEVHALLGHVPEARAAFEAALALEPRRIQARLGLARLLEDEGELEAARAELLRVLEGKPRSLIALYALARVHRALGRDDEAAEFALAHERAAILEDLREVESRNMRSQTYPRISDQLALAEYYFEDGRIEDAVRELTDARAIADTNNEQVMVLAGLLMCARSAESDEAAELESALAELSPSHPMLKR